MKSVTNNDMKPALSIYVDDHCGNEWISKAEEKWQRERRKAMQREGYRILEQLKSEERESKKEKQSKSLAEYLKGKTE